MLAIFQQIGLPEIILILAVLLLLFGSRKLPELARSLGRSTKEFKQGMKDQLSEGAEETEESAEAPEAEQAGRTEKKPSGAE